MNELDSGELSPSLVFYCIYGVQELYFLISENKSYPTYLNISAIVFSFSKVIVTTTYAEITSASLTELYVFLHRATMTFYNQNNRTMCYLEPDVKHISG